MRDDGRIDISTLPVNETSFACVQLFKTAIGCLDMMHLLKLWLKSAIINTIKSRSTSSSNSHSSGCYSTPSSYLEVISESSHAILGLNF